MNTIKQTPTNGPTPMRALVKEPFAPHDLPAGVEGFKLDQTRIRYTDDAGRMVVGRLNSSNRIYMLEGDASLIEAFATRADKNALNNGDCNGLTRSRLALTANQMRPQRFVREYHTATVRPFGAKLLDQATPTLTTKKVYEFVIKLSKLL